MTEQNDPDSLVVYAEASGSVDAAIERQKARLSQCEGLTRQDYETRGEWLSLAANLGNPFAQLSFSYFPEVVLGSLADIIRQPERVAEYKHRALTHLRSAAGNGNVNALERLGQAYGGGFLVPADPVLARSYQLAAMRADPRTERSQAEEAAKALNPIQRAEAARMAKEIYALCCEVH